MINEDERPPDDPTPTKDDKHSYSNYRFKSVKSEDLELATAINQEDYLKGLLTEKLYAVHDAHKKLHAALIGLDNEIVIKMEANLAKKTRRLEEVVGFICKEFKININLATIQLRVVEISNELKKIIRKDEDYVQDFIRDIVNNYITRDRIIKRYHVRNSHGKKIRKKHKTIRKNRKNGKTHNKRIKRKSHRHSNKRN